MKYFRDEQGDVKPMLDAVEGIRFRENPLDFFILLARYKFAARLLRPQDVVLDAGCGHGLGTQFLAQFAGTTVGADIDEELIAHCRANVEDDSVLRYEVRNLLDAPPKGEEFSAVVCMDVIEHFTQSEGATVLTNLYESLRPGGVLIMGTPNALSARFASARRKATHPYEYDPDTFRELLDSQFGRSFVFSMTDETISTSFPKLAWYLLGLAVKSR